jgi:hypothetical protein
MDDMKLAKGIIVGFLLCLGAAFTYTYDTATPVGTDAPSVIDDRIREVKAANQERMNVDHYWPLTGTQVSDSAAGQHRQVEFYGPISTPTNATNKGFLYTKDVSDKAELHFEDEDGNEIQVTSGGILDSANLTGNQTIAGNKTFSGTTTFSNQITSSLADGTAPFAITSTTKVTNLNADKVDGYDVSAYSGGESYTFAGGFIVKTGTASSTQDAAQTFTFGAAFPNSCVSVVTNRNDANAQYEFPVTTKNTAYFKIDRHSDISGTVQFDWIAIGY